MRDVYMMEGESFVLVYAVNSRDSFDGLYEFSSLVERIRDTELWRVPLVVVANKTDLPEDEWQVTEEEGRQFAERIGAPILFSSAMTGKNVTEIFHTVVDRVLEARQDALTLHSSSEDKMAKKKRHNACSIL